MCGSGEFCDKKQEIPGMSNTQPVIHQYPNTTMNVTKLNTHIITLNIIGSPFFLSAIFVTGQPVSLEQAL